MLSLPYLLVCSYFFSTMFSKLALLVIATPAVVAGKTNFPLLVVGLRRFLIEFSLFSSLSCVVWQNFGNSIWQSVGVDEFKCEHSEPILLYDLRNWDQCRNGLQTKQKYLRKIWSFPIDPTVSQVVCA